MNPLLYKEIHFQSVKYIINGQSTNINVFSWLSFFFKLREREREWYIKFGYKGEIAPKSLILFSTGFHWRIFLLSRANRVYAIFNTGLKNLGPSCPRYVFVFFTRSKWLWVCLPRAPSNNWLSYFLFPLTGRSPYFRFRVPANSLASTFLPPLVRRFC